MIRMGVGKRVMALLGALLLAGCAPKVEPMLPPEAHGTTVIQVGDHWKLAKPGGAIALKDSVLGRNLIVTHARDDRFHVFDSWCTHQGCSVTPSPAPGLEDIECPCHDSKFDLEGDLLKGPAPIPLIEYAATLQGDSLLVDLSRRTIRKK